MDEKDQMILRILKKNGRAHYGDIARAIGLTEGGVRHRVKRLIQKEIIKSFTIAQNNEKAIVLLKIDPSKKKDVVKQSKKHSETIFNLAGEYDLAILLEADSMKTLTRRIDAIRKVSSVVESRTLVKLAEC